LLIKIFFVDIKNYCSVALMLVFGCFKCIYMGLSEDKGNVNFGMGRGDLLVRFKNKS